VGAVILCRVILALCTSRLVPFSVQPSDEYYFSPVRAGLATISSSLKNKKRAFPIEHLLCHRQSALAQCTPKGGLSPVKEEGLAAVGTYCGPPEKPPTRLSSS
jgi:hypothetical protein